MGLRFNPPPNWPSPPPDFDPPPRWQPDPAWPPLPPGWQLWVPDNSDPGGLADRAGSADDPHDLTTGPGDSPGGPEDFTAGSDDFPTGPQDSVAGSGDFPTGPRGFADGQDDFSGPGHFATRPGDFSTGRGDFSTGADDFSTDPDAPAPPGKTNRWAIAAFILGLLGISLLGIIFAIVALRQIGKSRQRGKGLAIAGLVLSIIWAAALAAYLVLGNKGTPAGRPAGGGSHPSVSASSPPASPSGHGSSQTNVFALRAGQCFQNPPANQAVLGFTYVTVVPCTKLHNAQVFAEFPATGSAYPGSASLKRQADQGCHSRIAKNLETSKVTSSMSLHFLYPLPTSWAQGHRTITCLIVDSKTDLKSSVLRAPPAH